MSTSKNIVLKSSDGQIFEIEEAVALQSQTIAHMIEDDCVENGVPLPNVTGEILAKVIEHCKKHVEGGGSKEELKKWEDEFKKDIDQSTLFYLILAANYLNIKTLLDLTCQTVAERMSGKTPEEIRTLFNIPNDYTVEEETQIRQDNPWAFE